MADPIYPLDQNVSINLEELFERISLIADDDGKPRNLDGKIVTVSVTATGSTTIYHKLGRTPEGYIVLSRDEFCDIKQVSSDEDTLVLQSDVDATIKLLII